MADLRKRLWRHTQAAYTGGVKTVFIPAENTPDIDEVDKTVRDNITFIPVSRVDDIIDAALVSLPAETKKPIYIETSTATNNNKRICR